MVVVVGAVLGVQAGVRPWMWKGEGAPDAVHMMMHVVTLAAVVGAVLGAYALYVRATEQRWARELAVKRLPMELAGGVLLGGVLSGLVHAVLYALGVFRIEGVQAREEWTWILVSGACSALAAAVFEEMLLRGILLRLTQERLGSVWAILISSMFFGAAHAFNPGATLWSSAAIAIEAGVLLGAAYVLTQRLWLAIGLHAAWNMAQSSIAGGKLSGNDVHAILQSELVGYSWLSGGAFGVEASVVAVAVCGVAGIVLAGLAWKWKRFKARSWPNAGVAAAARVGRA